MSHENPLILMQRFLFSWNRVNWNLLLLYEWFTKSSARKVKWNDCNGTFLASVHGNGALCSFPSPSTLTSESCYETPQKTQKIEDFCNFYLCQFCKICRFKNWQVQSLKFFIHFFSTMVKRNLSVISTIEKSFITWWLLF